MVEPPAGRRFQRARSLERCAGPAWGDPRGRRPGPGVSPDRVEVGRGLARLARLPALLRADPPLMWSRHVHPEPVEGSTSEQRSGGRGVRGGDGVVTVGGSHPLGLAVRQEAGVGAAVVADHRRVLAEVGPPRPRAGGTRRPRRRGRDRGDGRPPACTTRQRSRMRTCATRIIVHLLVGTLADYDASYVVFVAFQTRTPPSCY